MVKRRYTRAFPRFPALQGLYAGYNLMRGKRARTAGSRTATSTMNSRNRMTSGIGVTTQYDRKLVYKKKYMPRGRKRRWKKFVNRVNAVGEKDLGSRTVLFNRSITATCDVANTHGCLTLALYSQKSSDSHLNDLNNVANYELVTDTTSETGQTGQYVDMTTKMLFQSAVMDITIRNSSTLLTTEGEVSTYSLDGKAKLEVDIYEMTMRNRADSGNTAYSNLSDIFEDYNNTTRNLGNSGTGITIKDRGATPFEIPFVLGRYGLKVIKKTKFFIPNGDTITYQIRDPKRYSVQRNKLAEETGFNRPGMTKIYYIIFKLVPGLTIGNVDGTYQQVVDVGCTTKYLYKVEGINEDRDRLITSGTSFVSPT